MEIRCIPKGYPLQNGRKSDEFLRGTPCKMNGNLWKSSAFVRSTPCKMSRNLWKSDEFLRGTLCKRCISNEFPRDTPCKMDGTLWKSVILMRLLSGCTFLIPPLTSCGSLPCHHPSTILLPRAYGPNKKKLEEAGTAGSED
jgi:hypothetical protein